MKAGKTLRILLIGASGNFGMRLARLIAREPGMVLVAMGRRADALRELAREFGCETLLLAREALTEAALRANAVDLVIDASGPFQAMALDVADTAISAGCHYVDLADSRSFVAQIGQYDAAARKAGVAILSGASSTPALSHAAIAALTAGWQAIDSILIVIGPANRQKRGRAVIAAILAGVGQPLRLFERGRWRTAYGWGGLRRVTLPGVGTRWASLCDTPDHDLLVSTFAPRHAARFCASLELPLMHLSLSALAMLVRWGVVRSLLPLAGLLGWLADRLMPFGNDWGGMIAEASGVDAAGTPVRARWWLAAKGDIGPNVPVLAALGIARKLRDGTLPLRGATACVGLLTLADFAPDFTALGMATGIAHDILPPPLFATALGDAFAKMPEVTQQLHRPAPQALWRGEGEAEGGNNIVAKLIARLFAFPSTDGPVPLAVEIAVVPDGSEHWARHWPSVTMKSRMRAAAPGQVEEGFGPFAFTLALDASPSGIDMRLVRAMLGPIPIPRWLSPRIVASERAEGGRHIFDVAIALPAIGRLVRYRGWLAPV